MLYMGYLIIANGQDEIHVRNFCRNLLCVLTTAAIQFRSAPQTPALFHKKKTRYQAAGTDRSHADLTKCNPVTHGLPQQGQGGVSSGTQSCAHAPAPPAPPHPDPTQSDPSDPTQCTRSTRHEPTRPWAGSLMQASTAMYLAPTSSPAAAPAGSTSSNPRSTHGGWANCWRWTSTGCGPAAGPSR